MKYHMLIFAALVIVLLAGCGAKPEYNEPSGGASPGQSDQSGQSGKQEKGFLGYVVKKEAGRILVVDSISKDYSSTGGMKNYYSAIWFSKAPSNVEIGQQVEVWAKGGIAESYPAQAEAGRLVIVPAFEPEGAVLSEAEAVSKALASPKVAEDNGVPAVKEVKFEPSASAWKVYIARNGEEEVMEILIEDIREQELGETPPLPVIKADGKAVTVYQSSYCWSGKSNAMCADYPGPYEMLKDKPKEPVKANTAITIRFDVAKPAEMNLTKFQDGNYTEVEITENSFRAPQEKGAYYYSLSANWMKEGSSNYVFAIEITGD